MCQLNLLGEAERDDDEEELRDEEDLEDTDGERRLEGAATIASDEVSCPAICINLAYEDKVYDNHKLFSPQPLFKK